MADKKSRRRIPSAAFLVTLVTGLFFTWFGLMESISGFFQKEIKWDMAIGGLMEALVFGASFLVVAWLLWIRPKIGSIILICLGSGMGIWMYFDWNIPNNPGGWIIPGIIVGLPIILGIFTLTREMTTHSAAPSPNNAG